eukprot:GFYU01011383.1.p1 GENE.GFYU01011383.1~~GFYU01011383.1.p1  ORF type:complete len:1075 (-),score=357.06 GFYU01011383.1:398-3499(-)
MEFRDPAIEREFRDYYFARFKYRNRTSLLLVSFIFLMEFPSDLDSAYSEEQQTILVSTRGGIVFFGFAMFLPLLYSQFYKKNWEWLNVLILNYFFIGALVLSYMGIEFEGPFVNGPPSSMVYLTGNYFLLRNTFRGTVSSGFLEIVLFIIYSGIVAAQLGTTALFSGVLLFLLLASFSLVAGSHVLQRSERVMYLLNDVILQQFEQDALFVVNLLPAEVADQLKEGRRVIAEEHPRVTVVFCEVVDFDAMVEAEGVEALFTLHNLHVEFDKLAKQHDVYKVESIFGEYMACCGCPQDDEDHVQKCLEFALDIQDFVDDYNIHTRGNEVKIRTGINSGAVTTGVIGKQTPSYNLFGDTVNVASRMKSTSEAFQIQLTEHTYKELGSLRDNYKFTDNGIRAIKGKGKMNTYYVSRLEPKRESRFQNKGSVFLFKSLGNTQTHVGAEMEKGDDDTLDVPGRRSAAANRFDNDDYEHRPRRASVVSEDGKNKGGRRGSSDTGYQKGEGKKAKSSAGAGAISYAEGEAHTLEAIIKYHETKQMDLKVSLFRAKFFPGSDTQENKQIRRQFAEYCFHNALPEMKAAMAISAAAFIMFVPIQFFNNRDAGDPLPDSLVINSFIRGFIGLTSLAGLFVLRSSKMTSQVYFAQSLVGFLALLAAVGLLVTALLQSLLDEDAPAENTCTALIVFSNLLLNFAGMSLIRAVTIVTLILIGWVLLVVLRAEAGEYALIYYFTAAAVLGSFGAYSKEKMSRQSFFLGQILDEERRKSQKLLFSMLPKDVVDKLSKRDFGLQERAFMEKFENLTIFFSDIKDFTKLASTLEPTQLLELLNTIYLRFDKLAKRYNIHKVCTIGDAFFGVCGCPEPVENHANKAFTFALEVQREMAKIRDPSGNPILIRVGLHSGTAMAGIVGLNKPRYLLYGEDVHHANQMEQIGIPNGIVCSRDTYDLLDEHYQTVMDPHETPDPSNQDITYKFLCESSKVASLLQDEGDSSDSGSDSSSRQSSPEVKDAGKKRRVSLRPFSMNTQSSSGASTNKRR